MWRANRLVDLLAKAAASQARVAHKIIAGLQHFSKLTRHRLMLLGSVTYAANNHAVQGSTQVLRDNDGMKARRRTGDVGLRSKGTANLPAQLQQPSVVPALNFQVPARMPRSPRSCSLPPHRRPLRPRTQSSGACDDEESLRRRLREMQAQHDEMQDETRVARWCASIRLTPGPDDARTRLLELATRVRARARAATDC